MKYSNLIEIAKEKARRSSYLMGRFKEETKGVAAIEFAFIAPLMLVMYIGTLEISNAVSANRKLSRVSSTVGDLLTQAECFSDTTLNDIVEISGDIMYPYTNAVKIEINGVLITSGTAKVQWSRAWNGGVTKAVGAPYTVPNKIKIDDNFLLAAKIQMAYKPTIGWLTTGDKFTVKTDTSAINMSEEMFLRPRIGNDIRIETAC
ncbi:MAG: TadE/TadG family type IV pilus assembly protein [Salaquimonas sp.]